MGVFKKRINDLIDIKSQAQQFLLCFNKVWLTEKIYGMLVTNLKHRFSQIAHWNLITSA